LLSDVIPVKKNAPQATWCELSILKRNKFHAAWIFIIIFYSYLLQLQAKYIPNMAKNNAAQYEVVAVDGEDGVQWWRWCWRWRQWQQR
jgi:hypothetical protein